jgi:hypothetical protein
MSTQIFLLFLETWLLSKYELKKRAIPVFTVIILVYETARIGKT